MRPLGIPVIADRCHQARVRNALEPEWEARFEPRSYGFRPGRGCHDAIEAIFNTAAREVRAAGVDAGRGPGRRHSTRSATSTCSDMLGAFPAQGTDRAGG